MSFHEAVDEVMPLLEFIGAMPLATKYADKDRLVHVIVRHQVVKRIQDVLMQYVFHWLIF